MKANHTSQKYRLEDNIAKNYPQQISALKERIAGMKADIATYNANKPVDKDVFIMTVAGKTYDDRKEAGTPEIDDIQMDVLYGNSIDLDDLRYVPQIWNDQYGLSKVGQIIDAFPDAKVMGELPGLTVQDRLEPDMDAVKPVYVDEAAKLAAEIDRFSSDFDPYEYKEIRSITGNCRYRT